MIASLCDIRLGLIVIIPVSVELPVCEGYGIVAVLCGNAEKPVACDDIIVHSAFVYGFGPAVFVLSKVVIAVLEIGNPEAGI